MFQCNPEQHRHRRTWVKYTIVQLSCQTCFVWTRQLYIASQIVQGAAVSFSQRNDCATTASSGGESSTYHLQKSHGLKCSSIRLLQMERDCRRERASANVPAGPDR